MFYRLVLGLGCAAAVLVWRFGFCDLGQARIVVATVDYYLLALSTGAGVWMFWRLISPLSWGAVRLGVGRHKLAIVVILWGAAFLHLHEPHAFKVTQDEPVHLVRSYVMHLEHTSQLADQAHYVGDLFIPSGFFESFRLGLFSFWVSLLHDLTGYRVENVFVCNAMLTPMILWVIWAIGRCLGGEWVGCMAAALVAGSPLLAQVMTSGSYDGLNLFLLGAVVWSTLGYVGTAADRRMVWMNLSLSLVVLLALSRYESIVYIGPWLCCVVYVWWRERRVELSWFAVVSPILVLPNLAANFITFATESQLYALIKGEGEPFFSLKFLPGHLADMVCYLFALGNRYANQPLVAFVGGIGLVGVIVAAFGQGTALKDREKVRVFAFWAMGITIVYGVVLASFWSSPLDDAATRFILPFSCVLALSAAWLAGQSLLFRSRIWCVPLVLLAGQLHGVAPVASLGYGTGSLVGARADAWLVRQALTYPLSETLFVSPVSASFVANKVAVVGVEKMRVEPQRFVRALKARLYERVIVCQYFRRSAAGGWEPMDGSNLPVSIRLEPIAERALGAGLMVTMSRFDGYVLSDGALIDKTSKHPDVALKEHFRSGDEATDYFRSLYP